MLFWLIYGEYCALSMQQRLSERPAAILLSWNAVQRPGWRSFCSVTFAHSTTQHALSLKASPAVPSPPPTHIHNTSTTGLHRRETVPLRARNGSPPSRTERHPRTGWVEKLSGCCSTLTVRCVPLRVPLCGPHSTANQRHSI